MSRDRVPVLGLVGGVGSGKSAVANWLGAHCRALVIDADAAGHRALTLPDVQRRLRERFGQEIIDITGRVRRDALARRVFGDDAEHREARHDLQATVHPIIAEDLRQQIADAQQRPGEFDLIVLDAAVLLETGWKALCDAVVFVDTPLATRQERVRTTRGWGPDELERREQSQLSLKEKQQQADLSVDNSQSLESTGRQIQTWMEQWRQTSPTRREVSE